MEVLRVLESDFIVLLDKHGNKFPIEVSEGHKKIRGLGVFDPIKLVGKVYGDTIDLAGKSYYILQPSIVDKVETITRKAQIITVKDSSLIAIRCDVKAGSTVVECGLGSGGLTLVLAELVKPTGKVITYEIRADFIEVGQRNLRRAGLDEFSEIKLQDLTEGIDEKNVDAVIIDIPNSWDAVRPAFESLRACGHFASYSPTTNQVEKTVRELRRYSFVNINTVELLLRNIVVGEGGVRPDFHMLGHTGYMTFARKML